MPDISKWKPSKAEFFKGRWRASRDSNEVGWGSRHAADLQVAAYADAIERHAKGVLVDLGCGQAPFFQIYKDKVSESIGVDWPGGLHQQSSVDVFSDLNEKVDLDENVADTILCTDVLEHIYKPSRLWGEMYRISKPGGKVIVGVPFLYWIHEAPHDYHRYTRFALRRYAEDAGFEVLELFPVGGYRDVLVDMLLKKGNRRFLRPFVWAATRCLLLGPLKTTEGTKFPLSYLLIAQRPAA